MAVNFTAQIIRDGKHASFVIPDAVLTELGTNRRAPLKVTINSHTYQSTSTGVAGECRVVFPSADRLAAGITDEDFVEVSLELDSGHREVMLHPDFETALNNAGLRERFDELAYSHRKEHARSISEAKAEKTRQRRIAAALEKLRTGQSPR